MALRVTPTSRRDKEKLRLRRQLGYLILVAPTTASVKTYVEWTKQQPGVASARAEIVVESINLWEKVSELFQQQAFPATKS